MRRLVAAAALALTAVTAAPSGAEPPPQGPQNPLYCQDIQPITVRDVPITKDPITICVPGPP